MGYLDNYCRPAVLYFILSMITIVIIAFQSMSTGVNLYCMGDGVCSASNVYMIYIIKLLYVFFWTWLLNVMCKGGAEWFSWFLVLIPYLLFLLFIVMYIAYN